MKTRFPTGAGFDKDSTLSKASSGFSLIELLLVIAIIGVLSAVAIPAFLGQQEKARVRSTLSSARAAVAEVQSVLDAFMVNEPFILLDADGNEKCYQSSTGLAPKTCAVMYASASHDPSDNYTAGNIGDIVSLIVDHHAGKDERSPYGSHFLFVSAASGSPGEVVITNLNAGVGSNRVLWVQGYARDTSDPIFNTLVSSR